jgi:hypothetical protein
LAHHERGTDANDQDDQKMLKWDRH